MKRTNRTQVSDKDIKLAFDLIEKKIKGKIAKRGMGAYASIHEIYGIIAEEFNVELSTAMHENNYSEFEAELLDVVVGALWGLVSMKALRREGVYE